jgi:hypothetical protein
MTIGWPKFVAGDSGYYRTTVAADNTWRHIQQWRTLAPHRTSKLQYFKTYFTSWTNFFVEQAVRPVFITILIPRVIQSAPLCFRREVAENCALLSYYAASTGDFLPTFRDNLSVPSSEDSWTLRMGPIGCLEITTTRWVTTQKSAVLSWHFCHSPLYSAAIFSLGVESRNLQIEHFKP